MRGREKDMASVVRPRVGQAPRALLQSGIGTTRLAMLGLAACMMLAAPAFAADDLAAARRFVEAKCAACHATVPGAPTHHPDAPTFTEIAARYPPSDLAEAFAEGIVVGHPDMPAFEFSEVEVAHLVRHLQSLR